VPLVASLSRSLYPLATGSAAAALSCQRDQTALIGEMTNTDLAIDSVFSASSGRQCSKVPRFLFVRFYLPVQSTPHELSHLERTLQSLLLSSVILPAMHGSAKRKRALRLAARCDAGPWVSVVGPL
jgi:streptomycin 6-kinase